jgi:hypothetical protein
MVPPIFGLTRPLLKVEIGLLHDLGYAKSIGTEPLTADDWEILVSLHLAMANEVLPHPVSGIARFSCGVEPDFPGQGRQHRSRN